MSTNKSYIYKSVSGGNVAGEGRGGVDTCIDFFLLKYLLDVITSYI